MIIDKLTNINRYQPRFAQISNFIDKNNLFTMDVGKHYIDDSLFVLLMEYDTKFEDKDILENHKDYIDFQVIISGKELIAFSNDYVEMYQEYETKQDYELVKANPSFISFNTGQFAVFFPNDYHKPGIAEGNSSIVKKAVFKLKFE